MTLSKSINYYYILRASKQEIAAIQSMTLVTHCIKLASCNNHSLSISCKWYIESQHVGRFICRPRSQQTVCWVLTEDCHWHWADSSHRDYNDMSDSCRRTLWTTASDTTEDTDTHRHSDTTYSLRWSSQCSISDTSHIHNSDTFSSALARPWQG